MKRIDLHYVISGRDTKGWVHTHGMNQYGLPELESRDVPGFLAEAAAAILNTVCDYMLDSGEIVSLGQTMALSPRTRFRFMKPDPIPGEEDHYDVERWQIVEVEACCQDCCLKPSELN